MSQKFQVLLIDDHAVVRSGCRLLLSEQEDLGLIESATGQEGLKLALDCHPDLVILDLGLQT